MSISSKPVIAIIGGGASGTILAFHLRRLSVDARVIVFDPAPHIGRGLAYSTPCSRHFLNVRSKGMSVLPSDPSHFLRWLRENVGAEAQAEGFAPRMVFGQYLEHCRDEADAEHIRARVKGCRRVGQKWSLELEGQDAFEADAVILALGNFDPAALHGAEALADRTGVYQHNAWSNASYDATSEEASVLLVGTGLTAVDVIMRLKQQGHRGGITALSRHGWAPLPHLPRSGPPIAPVVDGAEVEPRAGTYLRAFHKALREGTHWRDAVDSLRPVSDALWLALPVAERARFRRHLQRRWDIARHRIAPEIAAVLEAEQRAGRLEFAAGHVCRVQVENGRGVVTVVSGGEERTLEAARVINCTGPSRDYRKVGSVLLKTMLDEGTVRESEMGGLACEGDGALPDRAGICHAGLYALGPMRLGTLFESVAIPEIRQQAEALAIRLAAQLTGRAAGRTA